jgi:hypothetical protein
LTATYLRENARRGRVDSRVDWNREVGI